MVQIWSILRSKHSTGEAWLLGSTTEKLHSVYRLHFTDKGSILTDKGFPHLIVGSSSNTINFLGAQRRKRDNHCIYYSQEQETSTKPSHHWGFLLEIRPGGGRKPVKACCGRPWIVFVAVCKQEMSLFCTLSQWLVLFLFCFQKCFADYRPDINMTWYVCSVFKCAAMMHQRTQPFRTSSRPCLTRQVLAPNAWT